MPEAMGGDCKEPSRAQGQGRQLGGATHAGGQGPGQEEQQEEQPEEQWLCRRRRA